MRILKPFQQNKIQELINETRELLFNNDLNDKTVFFKAPTGSGKTIMVTNFIVKLCHTIGQLKFGFVWLTPARGDLHEQSKEKIEKELFGKNVSISVEYFKNVLKQDKFPSNTVAILNWEKATRITNRIFKDNEIYNVDSFIARTDIKLIIIVDEEHFAKTERSQNVINKLKPEITIRVSATPRISKEEEQYPKVFVDESEVKEAELIRLGYRLNEDLRSDEVERIGDDLLLLKRGIKQWEILSNYFFEEKRNVNPLLIIQLPDEKTNREKQLLEDVEFFLKEHKNMSTENGALAVFLDKRKINVLNLNNNKAKPCVVITKQAITQGWDCPRAQVLVKLRRSSNETFNLQTLGRICRVPEPEIGYYKNEKLNYAYVYTFDKYFDSSKSGGIGRNVCTTKMLQIKPQFKDWALTTKIINQKKIQLPQSEENHQESAKKFNHWFRNRYTSIKEESAGSNKLKKFLQDKFGTFETAEDTIKYKEGIISYDGRTELIERQIKIIYKGISILEELRIKFKREFSFFFERQLQKKVNFILQFFEYLFTKDNDKPSDQDKTEKDYFFNFGFYNNSDIYTRENQARFFCFLIKSRDKWLKELKSFYQHLTKEKLKSISSSLPSEKYTENFTFGEKKEYCFQLRDKNLNIDEAKIFNGSLYEGFIHYSLTKDFTEPEINFIIWLEEQFSYDKIDWWMRNSDRGFKAWKIIYIDVDGNLRNFFPDFIVSKNNAFWIFEVKDDSKQDNNVSHKFEHLKRFCENNQLNFAFIMVNKNREVKFNKTKWSDNFKSTNWQTEKEFEWNS